MLKEIHNLIFFMCACVYYSPRNIYEYMAFLKFGYIFGLHWGSGIIFVSLKVPWECDSLSQPFESVFDSLKLLKVIWTLRLPGIFVTHKLLDIFWKLLWNRNILNSYGTTEYFYCIRVQTLFFHLLTYWWCFGLWSKLVYLLIYKGSIFTLIRCRVHFRLFWGVMGELNILFLFF